MTRKQKHLVQILGYLVFSAAVLLAAHQGDLDWKLAAVTAAVFALPGVVPLLKLVREWKQDRDA